VLPDIAQAGRSQKRIGHRMTDHIGIGVPHQSPRMRDPKSSQDQWPTLAQPMCIMPDPDPHVQAPNVARLSRLSHTNHLTEIVAYQASSKIVAFSRPGGYPGDDLPNSSHSRIAKLSF
jgi:hypothetical protein